MAKASLHEFHMKGNENVDFYASSRFLSRKIQNLDSLP